MKKYIYLFVVLMISVGIVSAKNNKSFVQALSSCSEYSESGVVNSDGIDVNSEKRILGKKDDKCVYEEKISVANYNMTITCSFTDSQIQELTSVMNAYEVLSFSDDKLANSSENPVVKAWNKYLQDTSVCVIK